MATTFASVRLQTLANQGFRIESIYVPINWTNPDPPEKQKRIWALACRLSAKQSVGAQLHELYRIYRFSWVQGPMLRPWFSGLEF